MTHTITQLKSWLSAQHVSVSLVSPAFHQTYGNHTVYFMCGKYHYFCTDCVIS